MPPRCTCFHSWHDNKIACDGPVRWRADRRAYMCKACSDATPDGMPDVPKAYR